MKHCCNALPMICRDVSRAVSGLIDVAVALELTAGAVGILAGIRVER